MESFETSIHLNSLAETKDDLSGVLTAYSTEENKTRFFLEREYNDLLVRIEYPVTKPVEIKIPKASTVYHVLKPIADFYRTSIYSKSNQYGVKNHGIEDLYIEAFKINGNRVYILIGS